MKNRILALIAFTFICLSAAAHPVRPTVLSFTQPDGTTFQGKIYGDEFYRIKTTIQGHAIVQDEDGWWCYAQFDHEGNRTSSGYRIGENAPGDVLSESFNIPYSRLAENARRKRENLANSINEEPLMRRILKNQTATKGTDQVITKRALVILVEFADVKFKYTKENFDNILNQSGYSYNGATGCAKDYFNAQFGDMVEFEFEVGKIATLTRNRKYYGGNVGGDDEHPAEMVADACKAIDAEIDFSQYDDDNDGYVDNIFVFFAGEDEAEGFDEECIWSHSWYVLHGAGIRCELDGKIIDNYACTSELTRKGNTGLTVLTGIGTFCHEYSHTLGLPDMYDTDYDEAGGYAAALWKHTSLMDGGNANNDNNTPPYYNGIEREILGITEPVLLENDGSYTLEPIHKSNIVYRLNTDKEGEYYLFECRSDQGWDKYAGGTGMLVYHIDKSGRYASRWGNTNAVNATLSHQCADLIEADKRSDDASGIRSYNNIQGIFFPYSSTNFLSPSSTPGLKFWSGNTGDIAITNIQRSGENITFNVTGYSEASTPPSVASIKTDPFMDAAIIKFESSWAFDGDAIVTWGRPGEATTDVIVRPYESGKYAVILEDLMPGNKTYTVTIRFSVSGIDGTPSTVSFMTSKESPVQWPYIYIGKNKADANNKIAVGTKIALRTYNTADAAEIRWTFNGEDIVPEGDCYYTVQKSGTLKAYVTWKDGSEDIIEKKINTK